MKLVNCLGRDVAVCAKGQVVYLESVPAPRVFSPESEQATDLDVGTDYGAARLYLVDPGRAAFSLHAPPRRRGTLYLVDPLVLAAFSFRDDFVTPYRWSRVPTPSGVVYALQAVTRSLLTAHGETIDLTDEVNNTPRAGGKRPAKGPQ